MYKPKLYGKVNEDLMYRLWLKSGSGEDLVVKSRYGMDIEHKLTPFGEVAFIRGGKYDGYSAQLMESI